MSIITDKLKLIMEGHSIEDINMGIFSFSSIVDHSLLDESVIFFEAVSTDINFSSGIFAINESTSGIFDKIKRFISWIMEKIVNIIKWIQNKLFKKGEEVTTLANRVEKKIDSGEITKKIEAIKNPEKSIDTKLNSSHIHDLKKMGTVDLDHNNSDRTSEQHAPTPTLKQIKADEMKSLIPSYIVNKTVAERLKYAITHVSGFIDKLNESSIKILIRPVKEREDGPVKAEVVEEFIAKTLSDGMIKNIKDYENFFRGNMKEVELTAESGKLIIESVKRLTSSHEELSRIYKLYKNCLFYWNDKVNGVVATIDGQKNPEKVEEIIKHYEDLHHLFRSITSSLAEIMKISSKLLVNCEHVLKKFDSL